MKTSPKTKYIYIRSVLSHSRFFMFVVDLSTADFWRQIKENLWDNLKLFKISIDIYVFILLNQNISL